MPFQIEFTDLAFDELEAIRKFDQNQIIEAIDEQLTHQPTAETRRRKKLMGIAPAFEHNPPVWELRVGQFRVFYDVDEELNAVTIRAIREKPPNKTTEQIV